MAGWALPVMTISTPGQVWRWALAAAALSVLAPADASAQFRRESDVHARLAKEPLTFFVAHGADNACGAGCSRWIAVEGQFDKGSADRFAAFVKRPEAKDLPVFLNSTGGLTDEGIAFGRVLRGNGMRAGIAASKPDCTKLKPAECKAALAAGPVAAAWSSTATCSSACVFALLGASERTVPSEGKVGIHSTAYFCFREDGRVMQPFGKSKDAIECRSKLAGRARQLSRYIAEMGISGELISAMNSVPSSRIRFLTRDEITRYGIERREPPPETQ
jgi:hypothetical protein